VVDRTGAEMSLYVDGVLRDRAATPDSDASFSADPDDFRTVVANQVGDPLTALEGAIDEIWIYHRAIGDAEVLALHDGPGAAAAEEQP
jgi:hypothetical protein